MRTTYLIFFFCFVVLNTWGQKISEELYIPLEFQKAYENGTRSKLGHVTDKYWQNSSKYQIKASIDPKTRLLKGEAIITYYNNSPDTLKAPTFHAYHDYYKPNAKKAGFFSDSDANLSNVEHKGFVIDQLVIDRDTIDISDRQKVLYKGTNYTVRVQKPLAPNHSMDLKVHWNYVIPGEGFERSGAIDSTSMFVGYWYPEMAVFDDIDGWDRIVYDAATEFYHDFSDYEISLSVPDNFMVWASVAPENPEEVYNATVLQRLEQAQKSEKPVNILKKEDFRSTSSKDLTWKFKAEGFPDFAFALSDHFLWDAAMYQDEVGTFFVHTAYPENHPEFASVLNSMKRSLDIFHHSFPVYPFPYNYFTIFNGLQGGGMEFPGMANNQETSGALMEKYYGIKFTDEEASIGLTLHEMAHMYFPFMMGIHEKKYAWMDEGFASFSDVFIESKFPYQSREKPYLASQSIVPVMVSSSEHQYSSTNSYTISSAAYHALYKLLGKEMFLKSLHAFMDEWKHKHPTPYDFMYTFNRVTGTNLNWFWKKWYFDWGYMDLGITKVEGRKIEIENKGRRPLGFKLLMTFEDGQTLEEEVNPVVWKDNDFFTYQVKGKGKSLNKVELIVPPGGDAVAKNNIWVKVLAEK